LAQRPPLLIAQELNDERASTEQSTSIAFSALSAHGDKVTYGALSSFATARTSS